MSRTESIWKTLLKNSGSGSLYYDIARRIVKLENLIINEAKEHARQPEARDGEDIGCLCDICWYAEKIIKDRKENP